MAVEKMMIRIFVGLSLIYLSFEITANTDSTFFLKPLLLLPLVTAVIIHPQTSLKRLLIAALIFSWCGDVLLLFTKNGELYFILGLVSFLTAHIFYTILFVKEIKKADGKLKFKNAGLALIVLYLLSFLYVLFPHLGGLKIPVIIYALVITTMLFTAWQLSKYWPMPLSILLLTGALSFVLSDSILAINKFYQPLPYAGFLIMTTYLFAQGALVISWLEKKREV
ncbi:MAG: lysoplasmalogenase [Ginsengibacter sp.]